MNTATVNLVISAIYDFKLLEGKPPAEIVVSPITMMELKRESDLRYWALNDGCQLFFSIPIKEGRADQVITLH